MERAEGRGRPAAEEIGKQLIAVASSQDTLATRWPSIRDSDESMVVLRSVMDAKITRLGMVLGYSLTDTDSFRVNRRERALAWLGGPAPWVRQVVGRRYR
jgi:hypothetical protein